MLDELQLTYTSYNGQNLNSRAVSVIRGSTVCVCVCVCIYIYIYIYSIPIKIFRDKKGNAVDHRKPQRYICTDYDNRFHTVTYNDNIKMSFK
jgi:hypothetical protein